MPDFDFIIGFDFGHGETSVAMVDANKVSLKDGSVPAEDVYICEHSHEPKITSLVGYDFHENTDVDIDIYDFKSFSHIEAYFKGPLIASEEFNAITDAQRIHFRDFIVTVFNKVISNPKNVRIVGRNVRYYAACPSGWNDKQRDSYLAFLQNECGLPIVDVIAESRAAHVTARKKLHDRNPELSDKAKRLAVLDLGSSTLDITLHSDKTYTFGYEIGASQIEDKLLNYFIERDVNFRDSYNSYLSHYPNGKDDVLLFLRYAKEEYFNKQKKYPEREITFSCSIDWEELSQGEVIEISKLKLPGSKFLNLFLAKNSPKEDNYASKLRACINDFIDKYGAADAVVLTGGASQMDFYKAIVLDCYGLDENACVVDDTPSYSISQGVAMIGYMDSKCPKLTTEFNLPEDLQSLSDCLPNIINSEILSQYKSAYTNKLCRMVDLWKEKDGHKTLEGLLLGLDKLVEMWETQSVEVSKRINERVSDTVVSRINKVLKDIIRLYFGFDAPIRKFEIDYEFNFSINQEDNEELVKKIKDVMKAYINGRGTFHRWNDRTSLNKDRAQDKDLLNELPIKIKDYATRWFDSYNIEDAISEEVSDCRVRLREFYASTIRNITCQI